MFTRATLHLASHEPELALAELDAMEALEFDRLPDVLQAACTRALAIAQLGDFERAQELLDGLVPRVEEAGAPSLSALLHETQACVALAKGDPGQAQLHVDQVRARVRATGNPILIGTAERLQTITRQADSHDLTSASEVYSRDAATYVDGAATLARTVAPTYAVGEDRAERALEAFMEEVGASAGFLFLRSPAGWKLGAERGGASVPTGESLLRLVADVGGARPRSETWIESEDWEGGGWQWVVVDGLGGAACLIGVCGHRSTDAPPPAACQAVALALDEVAPSTPAEPGTQVTVPEVPEPRPRPSRP